MTNNQNPYMERPLSELEEIFNERWRENVKVENAIRIRLYGEQKPKLSPSLPPYIEDCLAVVRDVGKRVQADTAAKLLRALPQGFLDSYNIRVWNGPSHLCITVKFFSDVESEFALAEWIIYSPRWNWPGVEVILIEHGGNPMWRSRKYVSCHPLIQRTCLLLSGGYNRVAPPPPENELH